MKINALEYFVTLSESRSINEAAKKLYISQPSLTKALQGMEEELGTKLFQRTANGIALTAAGRKMLPEAKQVVEYYRGWKHLSAGASLEQIDIYTYFSFPDFLFPEVLWQFRKRHSEVTVNCTTTADLETHISQNTRRPSIVLMICREDESYDRLSRIQGNEPIVLMEGEYRCLVNSDSPLAKKKHIKVQDLLGYYLIAPNLSDYANLGFVEDILGDINTVNPKNKVIAVESAINVVSLVSKQPECFALSYYPALKRYRQTNLVDIPFHGMNTKGKMCIFYSQEACQCHPMMQELIRMIKEAAEDFLGSYILD